VKRTRIDWLVSLAALAVALGAVLVARAQQSASFKGGTDFKYPVEFWPEQNGVIRKKTLVTGARYEPLSNSVVRLTSPRIERFEENGTTLSWTAISSECVLDMDEKKVNGTSKLYFRTADERLYHTGVGFLWQQTNSLLIISNKVFTWIDKKKLTNAMVGAAAVSIVSTTRLTAAEIQTPPQRPGLTITADFNVFYLTNNSVLYSNNVLVIDPPAKTNGPPTTMTCLWLTGKRNPDGTIDEIVAHERVAIDQGDLHARGNFAVYTGTNEMTVLLGPYEKGDAQPYLFKTQGTNSVNASTNSADKIIYDRLSNQLYGYGNITTKVAQATMQSVTTNSPGATNRVNKNPSPPH